MKLFNKKSHSSEAGFSIVEILVALTVLSFLMVGTINLSQNSQETAERVVVEDKELLQIETAMSRLEWDFSQIFSPLYYSHTMNPEFMTDAEGEIYNQLIDSYQNNSRFSLLNYDGIPVPLFQNPESSTFIFFTSSNRRKMENSKQSNFAWVKYSLEADDLTEKDKPLEEKAEKKAMMLVRNFYTRNIYDPDEINWGDVKTQVLLRKIIKLTFEFWNPETLKWTDNLDTIKNGFNIVHALRITILYYDTDNIEKTSMRIFRPLFPEFTPEDMYKFLNEKSPPKNGEANEGENTTTSTTTNSGGDK